MVRTTRVITMTRMVGMTSAMAAVVFSVVLTTPRGAASSNWERASPDSTKLSVLETTPWGLLAGENDTRLWLKPFNGIYVTKDLGQTWAQLGLSQRGITDIHYDSDTIYATTYYHVDGINGLFVSRDGGRSWDHLLFNFSASTVSAYQSTIILGGVSHGLWVSHDDGETWEQKMGDGFFGPRIYKVKILGDIAVAALESQTFVSRDRGDTWTEVAALIGNKARSVEIYDDAIFVATTDNGILKSSGGTSWEKIKDGRIGAISYYKGLYAGVIKPETVEVLATFDEGQTWQDTEFSFASTTINVLDIAWLFSFPEYLFIVVSDFGVYRYRIPTPSISSFQFLDMPWRSESSEELIEKIYSFFDHEYPLLGYSYHAEPAGVSGTTLNFQGKRDSQPYMYYSSHDGYDFSLRENTPVLAAAGGTASYEYHPGGLGNTIRIDHQNGYQTTYAHLQSTGLITTSEPIKVEAGNQIGFVGNTGNSTGPHLHFSVVKDIDDDGEFEDNSGSGKVDPYAWQAYAFDVGNLEDPWMSYKWSDALGDHVGSESPYLWKKVAPNISKYMSSNLADEVSLGNKKFIVGQNSLEHNFTVFMSPWTTPRLPPEQANSLLYVDGTSVVINLYDNLGNGQIPAVKPLTIEIDLTNADLENVFENSLKIYFWNEATLLWEALPSIFDAAAKIISAQTDHFSHFAVMGERRNSFMDTAVIKTSQFVLQGGTL